MGVGKRIRLLFGKSRLLFGRSTYVTKGNKIGTDLVKDLINDSDFSGKTPYEVSEILYRSEPDIGGGVDRIETLASSSYRGPFLKDPNNPLSNDEIKCLELAKHFSEELGFEQLVGQWTGSLYKDGNVIVVKEGLQQLPMKYVTIGPKDLKKTMSATAAITKKEILYLNEGDSQLEEDYDYIEEIYHLKYTDVPLFIYDVKGRETFGIYSLSPLERLKNSTWWKRQLMIIDVLIRWRIVPREHHQINGESFNVGLYPGANVTEKKIAAKADLESTISSYINKLKEQMPDQGYVTTNDIEIKTLNNDSNYMGPNNLIDQLDKKVWEALNLPESVVSGQSTGSFASELATFSYVSLKISSIMSKIRPILLDILKSKISEVDKSLPYHSIDIDMGFDADFMGIENLRGALVMGEIGVFTEDEIREHAGYSRERDGDPYVVNMNNAGGRRSGEKTPYDITRDVRESSSPSEPFTPHSNEKHKRREE